MSIENDEIILTQRFKAILDASAYSTIKVDYPGYKVEPASGEVIRLRFGHGPSQLAQVGGGRRRNFGSVLIQIVIPSGTGKARLLKIADVFISGFHQYKSGALRCKAGSYRDGIEESGFITGTVDVPYHSDYSS